MNDALPIVTCRQEGGLYSPDHDPRAPIRIYADGSIKDDYFGGERERITQCELEQIVEAANSNRQRGLV